MASILDAVVPLFAVIFAGYLAGRTRILAEDAVRGLNRFVFTFAMPPMLFRLMATTDVTALGQGRFLFGFFWAELMVFLFGAILGGLVFRQRFAEMVMQGFGSSFSNGVLIALPLLISLHGEAGAVPALLLFTLDVLMFSAITIMLEAARAGEGEGAVSALAAARTTGMAILQNPIIMATLLGILWGIAGLPMPSLVSKTFGFLGQAGPPAALFALGATLAYRRVRGSVGSASGMVVLKLFAHPALVFLTLTLVVPVEPFWVHAAVVFAACPVGANVYVFAQHYGVQVTAASAAILVSTGLSMLTITALLVLYQPPLPV
ncbi:AEC family transporter [Thalassobaculum sp.]|uniref:AEC family transporter n=1 Tax=Thalassobaculum sp. TaxID=2022740 RepID=UPI0032EEE6DC